MTTDGASARHLRELVLGHDFGSAMVAGAIGAWRAGKVLHVARELERYRVPGVPGTIVNYSTGPGSRPPVGARPLPKAEVPEYWERWKAANVQSRVWPSVRPGAGCADYGAESARKGVML